MGEGGAKMCHSFKGGGGVLPCLEGEGGGAKSFGPAIFTFFSPHPLPIINDQSLMNLHDFGTSNTECSCNPIR